MLTGVSRTGAWLGGVLRRVLHDTRGAVAVYIALSTMFLLPLVAMSIDLTKYYTLNTELELAAQAAALSAAKELDFTDAGLAAAIVAARQTVRNFQTGATDDAEKGADVEISTIQFLRALPPAGESNYGDYISADAKEIRYVRTITEIRARESFTMNAYLAIWKTSADATAGTKFTIGSAVAGRTAIACKTLPLMTCNPAEGNNDITSDFPNDGSYPGIVPGFDFLSDFLKAYPEWTRRQLRIKFIGPDTGYTSGVFGWLEPQFTENHGANGIADEIALNDPTSCIILDEVQAASVDVKTGQAQSVVNGVNVRLDIFKGKWASEKNNASYPPARNNTKGLLPKSPGKICTPDPAEPGQASQKLPQDECFIAETEAELLAFNPKCYALGTQDGSIVTKGNNKGFAGRYGNGRYDIIKYMEVNHPGSVVELAPGVKTVKTNIWDAIVQAEADWLTGHGMNVPAVTVNPSIPPGRHGIYLWEDDTPPNLIPGTNTSDGATPIEEGTPQCSSTTPAPPIRRNLFVAVINCIEYADVLGSGDRIVTVQEFAEMFITEAADSDASGGASSNLGAIYVEVKRAVKPGDTNNIVLRDLIQLY